MTDHVSLSWVTPDAERQVMYMARVSSETQDSSDTRLLAYLIKHSHWSPFEMCSMAVEITTSRAISPQILRHRSFSFQEFCISADSMISLVQPSGRQIRRSIEWLYNNPNSSVKAKVYDEETKQLKPVKIKEVFNTGLKETYKVTLSSGRSITTTLDHKFMSKEGFKKLQEITEGDFIAVNGQCCYQDKSWLSDRKQEAILDGTGVSGIALKAGVSYYTIRKWLKRLGLQFSKKEVASYTSACNKGLPSELQPMYGKLHSDETRERQHSSSRKGCDSNLFVMGNPRKWRQQIFDWQNKYLNRLRAEQPHCQHCYSKENLETDHIKPVSQNPELSFVYENLQTLCKICHKIKTNHERSIVVKWDRVESIEFYGTVQTYDMEVDHTSHNYVANGIITHNSQRYAEASGLIVYAARRQDIKNRQNSLDDMSLEEIEFFNKLQVDNYNVCFTNYQKCLEKGIAKECARVLLPLGIKTKMYMSGTLRSWIHYMQVRCDPSTQLEHRNIANQIKKIFAQQFPTIAKALGEV